MARKHLLIGEICEVTEAWRWKGYETGSGAAFIDSKEILSSSRNQT